MVIDKVMPFVGLLRHQAASQTLSTIDFALRTEISATNKSQRHWSKTINYDSAMDYQPPHNAFQLYPCHTTCYNMI